MFASRIFSHKEELMVGLLTLRPTGLVPATQEKEENTKTDTGVRYQIWYHSNIFVSVSVVNRNHEPIIKNVETPIILK